MPADIYVSHEVNIKGGIILVVLRSPLPIFLRLEKHGALPIVMVIVRLAMIRDSATTLGHNEFNQLLSRLPSRGSFSYRARDRNADGKRIMVFYHRYAYVSLVVLLN